MLPTSSGRWRPKLKIISSRRNELLKQDDTNRTEGCSENYMEQHFHVHFEIPIQRGTSSQNCS